MTNQINTLYEKLQHLKVDKAFARKHLFPSWWDDEIASSDAGLYEAMAIISARLGIPLSELRQQKPQFPQRSNVRFKLNITHRETDVIVAERLALQTAKYAVMGFSEPIRDIPLAKALRADILKNHSCVSFEALLDWCWNAGILVLHVSKLPANNKKMTGCAAIVSGRPVIVLCDNHKHPAWLLFHLAHELGHIAMGHLGQSGAGMKEDIVLADSGIDESSNDPDEIAANKFAIELLTGFAEAAFRDVRLSAEALVQRAKLTGGEYRIDPGHIALNYARTMGGDKFFAVANKALSLLGGTDPKITLRLKMRSHIQWGSISDDAREFVERMTGLNTLD